MGTPNRLTENPQPASIRLKNGEIIEHPLRCHQAKGIGDVSARFPKYEPAFRYHGCITDGFIGEAKAQLCDARKMRDVMMLITARSGGAELLADYEPLDEARYR